MRLLGRAIRGVLDGGLVGPIHLVVPDRPTADLLATAADSLAGVELSRLRWQHDLDSGRPALTFDGEPATVPDPLAHRRAARGQLPARGGPGAGDEPADPASWTCAAVLASHLVHGRTVPSTPAVWTTSSPGPRPATRWTTGWSPTRSPSRPRPPARGCPTPRRTRSTRPAATSDDCGPTTALVRRRRWTYRIEVLERALAVLDGTGCLPAAQRSSRPGGSTPRWCGAAGSRCRPPTWCGSPGPTPNWRNSQVDMLDADRKCFDQLTALADALRCAGQGDRRRGPRARAGNRDRPRPGPPGREVAAAGRRVAGRRSARQRPQPRWRSRLRRSRFRSGSFKLGQLPIATPARTGRASTGLFWEPSVPTALADRRRAGAR